MSTITPLSAVQVPTIDHRAQELRATAEYVHTGDMPDEIGFDYAERNWIAATLPEPRAHWEDYCRAVGLLFDLQAGLVGWADVEPGLTCIDRQTVAFDLASETVAGALFPLLFGPEARACRACKRTDRDVWSPSVSDGLCREHLVGWGTAS